MDPTTFAPADWAALTSSVPKIAALAGLALSVGLALALLLTFLVGSPASAEVASRLGAGQFNTVAPTEPSSTLAKRLEPALVAPAARVGAATADLPSGVGLSPTDVIALRALRERVQSGEVAEGPTSADRFAFARWLVDQGRLSG
jgi:hypothetical protein